jgi:hypothetical protein
MGVQGAKPLAGGAGVPENPPFYTLAKQMTALNVIHGDNTVD